MKKWIIAGLGMGMLTACGGVAFVLSFAGGPVVKTEYRIQGTNTYIGCDFVTNGGANSKNTQVRVDFAANADLDSVNIRLVGNSDGNDNGFNRTFTSSDFSTQGTRRYAVAFDANSATNALPTAIVVVPKDQRRTIKEVAANSNIGSFKAVLTAKSGGFTAITQSASIPVYSNCTILNDTGVPLLPS